MKLGNILQAITTRMVKGNLDKEISGIQMDSRQIKEGDLFVAVKGTQTDGHAYIGKAIEKGATAVVCETLPETLSETVTYIQVNDSEDAVGRLATTFYGDPTSKLDLIGVTGTNGKTTIATLLYPTLLFLQSVEVFEHIPVLFSERAVLEVKLLPLPVHYCPVLQPD